MLYFDESVARRFKASAGVASAPLPVRPDWFTRVVLWGGAALAIELAIDGGLALLARMLD